MMRLFLVFLFIFSWLSLSPFSWAQYDYYSDPDIQEGAENIPQSEFEGDEKADPPTEDLGELPDTVDDSEEASDEVESAEDDAKESTSVSADSVPMIRRDSTGPVYDGKKRYINHPLAEKGLIYITREKIHYYQTKPSKQDRSASVRFGIFDPTELTNKDGLLFSEIYLDSDQPMLLFDYEWQFWRFALGKLGFKIGTGLYMADGTGRFETNTTETPREKFSFFIFPNHASLVYHLQIWDRQWFVPYADGGVDYFAFAEHRDDDKNPDIGAKLGGALASHFAGGLKIPLRGWSRSSALDLDSEYGINSIWLNLEFRVVVGLSDTFDFSSQMVNGGINAEF